MPFVGKDASFEGHTLVLPAVSYGNVGQLAIDALLNTQKHRTPGAPFSVVGHFHSEHLLPVAGNDALSAPDTRPGTMTVNGEVFQAKDCKVTVLQLRSRHIKGRGQLLTDELLEWVRAGKFACVVLVGGADGMHRMDAQLGGSQVRYHTTEAFDRDDALTGKARAVDSWKRFEDAVARSGADAAVVASTYGAGIGATISGMGSAVSGAGAATGAETPSPYAALHGLGMAKRLFEACSTANVPLLCTTMFVNEGDNRAEGLTLASVVNDFVGVVSTAGSAGGPAAATGAGAAASAAVGEDAAATTAKMAAAAAAEFVAPECWALTYKDATAKRTLYL